jgi:hypothetical protein
MPPDEHRVQSVAHEMAAKYRGRNLTAGDWLRFYNNAITGAFDPSFTRDEALFIALALFESEVQRDSHCNSPRLSGRNLEEIAVEIGVDKELFRTFVGEAKMKIRGGQAMIA